MTAAPPAVDARSRTIRDQADRDTIVADLDSTLFVEAGAGSGKTTALVDRVLALLDDGVAMENIAAITFTEKAAAELKTRLRQKLSDSGKHPDALDQLDGAAITTLHGFALRILSQHAIEAGLPPRLEVSPRNAFEDRWEESRSRLLHNPDYEHAVVLARILGIQTWHLRDLAQTLDDNWDLVAERLGGEPSPTGPVELPDLDGFPDRLQDVADLAQFCRNPEDNMLPRLKALAQRAELLRRAEGGSNQAVSLLLQPGLKFTKAGRKGNWPDEGSGHPTLSDIADELRELGDAISQTKTAIADAVISRLTLVLGALTLEAAADRRQRGVLEFHDLLVLARDLLRDPEHGTEVRASLAERYQRLLLDEFQDTDPIQIDLAKLIATPPADTGDWGQLQDRPGRLFYVGDPKQSIYRFRRADIAVFTEAGAGRTVARKSLTRNFRTVEPIIAWINGLFDEFMAPPSPGEHHVQPDYQALDPVRGRPPAGPPVAVLNTEHPQGTRASLLREAEADEVAQAILTAIAQGWSVGDGRDENNQDRWRPARLDDICILLPTRTSLAQLEPALERHGIPYRIESGSLIWTSRAIRDVITIVRAVADPTDEVALVNALRSPAFGCGDDDLYTFKVAHRGRWNHLASLPPSLPHDHPVGEAMTWLSKLHADVRWLNPGEVLERIVRERRLMESGCFGSHRPRDRWRSLQLVIDQARQFEESGGRGLREFIAWVDRKISERTRESDVILSETDDDAVRITTIHASKGREFPIVILSGTYSRPRPMTANLVWPQEGGYGVRFNNSLLTNTFAEHRAREEQMEEAERVRLLYVALTRARDHLVVSAHRPTRGENSTARPSMADMVVDNAAELPEAQWQPEPLSAEESSAPATTSFADWRNARETSLADARKRLTVSGSAIAQMAADEGADPLSDHDDSDAKENPSDRDSDDQQAPWRKGRGGTQIGKAVHGVLQTVDLDADPDRIDPVVRTQAEAEGIPLARSTIRALAKSALESSTVRAAATGEHWKELFVAAPVEDTVVEGYIDLLYRSPGEGLVVVDYKTDDIHDDDARQAKIDRYRLQVAAYSLAVEQAVGEEVSRCVLVFARDGQAAEEVTIADDDLASAQQEVCRRLADSAA